jgi:hypothetical protein
MAKAPSLSERMKSIQRPPVHLISVTPEAPAEAAAPAPATTPVNKTPAKSREGMKRATALMTPEDHRRLLILRANTGKSVEALLDEAVADLFAKHGA